MKRFTVVTMTPPEGTTIPGGEARLPDKSIAVLNDLHEYFIQELYAIFEMRPPESGEVTIRWETA